MFGKTIHFEAKWKLIYLVDIIDLEHFLVLTGKVRFPGTLLY